MSVFLLTLPLLWAQVNPAPPGPAAKAPEAAQVKEAGPSTKAITSPNPAQGAANTDLLKGPIPEMGPTAADPAQAAAGAPKAAVNPFAGQPVVSEQWGNILAWVYLTGDPGVTLANEPSLSRMYLLGGLLFWVKAVSLLCLVGWVLSWAVIGIKERAVGPNSAFNYVILAAVVMTPLTVMLRVLESVQRIPVIKIGSFGLTAIAALTCLLLYMIWVEVTLWRTIGRLGRALDVAVLVGAHLAMAAGLAIGLYIEEQGYLIYILALSGGLPNNPAQVKAVIDSISWREGVLYGSRMGLTYMGYIVGLRILGLVLVELVAIRWRRLYSIARLSIYEANRRMWAPWVVITVFLLVLAFTHWFLQPPRAAEMGRLYVGTLTLLCSVLLTAMVTILTPLSIPTDIQQQTIYTVVSKPVRRLELIWGRMIGYMGLVSVLVVLFGGVSLAYLRRTVGSTIEQTESAALKAQKEIQLLRDLVNVNANASGTDEAEQQKSANRKAEILESLKKLGREVKPTDTDEMLRIRIATRGSDFKLLAEQADQLRTRLQARFPIKGSLSFLDSRGLPHAVGIDVGQDQGREPRSHIEGATPSAAIWSFGIVPDPFTPPGRRPRALNRRIPVDDFLTSGTIEWDLDRVFLLREQIQMAQASKSQANLSAAATIQIDEAIARNQKELDRISSDYEEKKRRSDELEERAAESEAGLRTEEAQELRKQIADLHSPPVTVEMSFNVYRTTKGKIGEPVYAEIQAFNTRTEAKFEGDVFPIKEYYTNRVQLPASILAGSGGALRIEIRCLSPTQYLGMAESDLYLLPASGNFGVNYMKGLFGIWLQAMVLTAIGVFAGTFLSWPVALVTTIAFFIAGQLAFTFLVDFSRQAILGGGPFEAGFRLLTHDNQMSELAPTAPVVLAKTLDSLVMPLMSMLVFIVPNFNALDVSNLVADGYAVTWSMIALNSLLAIAYALPFSLVGYFILKNREVAA
jgi:hypothetical protein